MLKDTVAFFSALAIEKTQALARIPGSFAVGAMMAGAYVGIGIILIFTVGASVDATMQAVVMGASFGIALTLVVFAGSELFTGHTMYMVIGWLGKKTGLSDLTKVCSMSWFFNLVGAFVLAVIFAVGGGGKLLTSPDTLLMTVADYKMNSTAPALVARGILCNWLVCLALWMSARTESDSAKCILIFWCLYAFIASGFEHSVANMTVFSLALLGNHPEMVTVAGMFHNLLWVTIGNFIGGGAFMGLGYWLAAGMYKDREVQLDGLPNRDG